MHTPVKSWLFQIIDLVDQGGYDGELDGCGFLRQGSIELRESVDKRREVAFMVFAIEPRFVPSRK
jgi:hypothetical protein